MPSERILRQIDRLLDEADAAISRFDWEAVRQCAQAVLALDPANTDGVAVLAAANRALPETSQASPPSPVFAALPQEAESLPSDPQPAPDFLPASFANGRYRVKSFLGEGGRKIVYLAHDEVFDREMAIAVIKTEGLDATTKARITREAQVMGQLGDHPNILAVHDLGFDNGHPFLVMPVMTGGDLSALIHKAPDHRLSNEATIDIVKSVCRGLEFAHNQGIMHRDLKPGNVWLTENGTPKIGDFGLAVAIDPSRLNQEGMMMGTVSYMAPEQALGGEVTPRADLYSLGAMLYEMVAGRPPFLGDDSVAIIGQHINTPPVAPTWHNGQCPRPLEALILRLLAKDPSERPQSASDVLAALDGLDLTEPVVGAQGLAPLQAEAHALDSLAGGVFVGRQAEMGELKAALEDALSGRGRLVTLMGEPGIGKTRTAQELATYAGLRSAQVMWGRCYEEQGMPPYWPWVQAIRSYVRERKPEQLRSEMGAGAADIAEVVPDIKERLPDLQPPPQLESPEQARFRLFDSITAFLKTASQKQPLVLVLDDLHWADQPSLMLLQFVARELGNSRLLLVGTYRDMELSRQHPLAETLGELTRERLFQRVLLRGLSQQDVGRFIEVAAGVDPPSGLAEAVHTQTEGNPLFVTEVVRLLVQEGELSPLNPPLVSGDLGELRHRDSWTVRLPEGVLEVIGRRLNRLSRRCNETLTVASVIGREFELRQLAPLMDDMSSDRLLEVLEEALVARLIEESPQAVGQYQFSHNMIQRTLVDELSTTRKVRLHARIAEALENLYQADAGSQAVELAYHFAEAEAVTGSNKLVLYSTLAGERALLTHAWEKALTYFQQALSAKEGQAMDSETAALWFGLGQAQAATLEADQIQAAVASLRRSFDYYAGDYYSGVGDVEPAVGVAEYPFPLLPGRSTGVAQLIESALALVPPDSHAAGRLLSQKIRVLVIEEGDFDGAQEAFNRALDIARREGDEALEMRILASATVADFQYLRLQGGLVKSLRAIELASMIDDPRTEVDARFFSALGLWWMGDLEGLFRQAQLALIPAEQLRDRYWLASSLWTNEIPCSLSGNWVKAREFNDRCLAVAPTDPRPLYTRALLESEVGDFDQAEAHLDQFLEVMRRTEPGPTLVHAWTAMAVPIIQRVTGVVDRLDVAEAAARTVLSATAPTPYVAMMTRAGLGLLAVLRNDAAAAEQQYDALRSGPGVMVPSTFMPFIRMVPASFMSTARLLALLAQTSGKLDLSVNHFEDGLLFCRRANYRPELAWTCCDYADLLLQLGAPDSRERAGLLLEESLTIAQELGMVPLRGRVTERLDRIGAPEPTVEVYPDGLTRREVDVLRLVASGKSNQEIAEELFISLRTVANHVTNILGKINANNRTEAAIYAARQGLT